jgi:hypothetical protein
MAILPRARPAATFLPSIAPIVRDPRWAAEGGEVRKNARARSRGASVPGSVANSHSAAILRKSWGILTDADEAAPAGFSTG